MKIIQIMLGAEVYQGQKTNERLFGLSDEGKLYRWRKINIAPPNSEVSSKDEVEGWVEIEDELNFCHCGGAKEIDKPTCLDCQRQSLDLIEEEKINNA